MNKQFTLFIIVIISFWCCSDDNTTASSSSSIKPTFTFSHNWDGEAVTSADFGSINYTNDIGNQLSMERLRYVISKITFTGSSNEVLSVNIENPNDLDDSQKNHHLIDLNDPTTLSFNTKTFIPIGNYTVAFTFGLTNEANTTIYTDLNSASFNVPDMLGGGYHYMQLDGKFINANSIEQGYNYHAIRAVDNPGTNPTFPQDTFFTVNLGTVTVTNEAEIKVEMNIAEWFKNPNTWDLNVLNQTLMPNSNAQIEMFENGQNAFSLATE